jgi:tRNA(fMet)-specific endonuclease VapC
MYLFDTNFCSRIILGDDVALTRLQTLSDLDISTCVIVQGELIFMAENSEQKVPNLDLVHSFLREIRIFPIDEEASAIYGQLKAAIIRQYGPKERSKRRKVRTEELGVTDNDLWIASIAIQHSLTLISTDADFRRMKAARAFALEAW